MTTANIGSNQATVYVLGQGGPSLLDMKVETPEIQIWVNPPGILYSSIRVLTSLNVMDGCDWDALSSFAQELEVVADCGYRRPEQLSIEITGNRLTPYLELDLGFMSMYLSIVRISTLSGQSIQSLIERSLNTNGISSYLVALAPVQSQQGGGHHMDMHEGIGERQDL